MKFIIILSIVNLLSFLLFNYFNIFLGKKINLNKFYVLSLMVSAAVLAYCTIPDPQDDLSRYYQYLDGFRTSGFDYLIDFPYKDNPITIALFLVISFIGNNHLLPVVVVTFYCLVLSLVIRKIKLYENPRLFSVFIVILYSFFHLNGMISGVRFPLATALFILILFYDKNEKYYTLLYFTPTLIHTSYIFMFLVVLLVKLQSKIKIPISRYIVFIPYLAIAVAFVFPDHIPLLSDAASRLLIYINPTYSFQYIDVRLWASSIVLFVVYTYTVLRSKKRFSPAKEDTAIQFSNMMIPIMIGLLPFVSLFSRFLSLYLVVCLPSIKNIKFKSKFNASYCLIAFVCLGVFAYRMVNAIHYWRFMFF